MKVQKKVQKKLLENPVFHELTYQSFHYAKVYWPIRRIIDGSYQLVDTVIVKNDSTYLSPNGSKITVVSIFDGKMYPMVNYQIEGSDKILSTSLSWFANNIVYKKS